MTTITKERLLTIKQWRETYGPGSNVVLPAEEAEELARIALASLEAEPVAWKVTFTQIDRECNTFTGMYSDKAEVERWVRLHEIGDFRADITPLYTAQQVPVTPDGWISCSERMPEKYDFDIWVFSPSRGVLDGPQWDGSMFTDDEYQFVIHDATHWMRKAYPAAPQQDGE